MQVFTVSSRITGGISKLQSKAFSQGVLTPGSGVKAGAGGMCSRYQPLTVPLSQCRSVSMSIRSGYTMHRMIWAARHTLLVARRQVVQTNPLVECTTEGRMKKCEIRPWPFHHSSLNMSFPNVYYERASFVLLCHDPTLTDAESSDRAVLLYL